MNKIGLFTLSISLFVASLNAYNFKLGKHSDGKGRINKECKAKGSSFTECTYYNFRGVVKEIKTFNNSSKLLDGKYTSFHHKYSYVSKNCNKINIDPTIIHPDSKIQEKIDNGYIYDCKDLKKKKESGMYYRDTKYGMWKQFSKVDGRSLKSKNYGPKILAKNDLGTKVKKERYSDAVQYIEETKK